MTLGKVGGTTVASEMISKSASREAANDSEAEVRTVPALFTETIFEHRPPPEPRDIQVAGRR
jgi:hypothetical protein